MKRWSSEIVVVLENSEYVYSKLEQPDQTSEQASVDFDSLFNLCKILLESYPIREKSYLRTFLLSDHPTGYSIHWGSLYHIDFELDRMEEAFALISECFGKSQKVIKQYMRTIETRKQIEDCLDEETLEKLNIRLKNQEERMEILKNEK